MAKPTTLLRHCILPLQPRRQITNSSGRRSSTSPQRRAAAALAVSAAMKPFTDIPGPLALPMLRHSAHVLPRIGSYHHSIGLGLLEGLRDRYGNLVRLAKASRTRPVLYVFDPQIMREVYESGVTEPPRWDKSPLEQYKKKNPQLCPMHREESSAIWEAIRSLLRDGTLLRNYDKAFDDISTDAMRRLGDLRYADNALNEELETEIYRWALETVGMVVFGIRLGCLDGAVHIPTAENRKPEKTPMDEETPELCSLTKKSFEELTPAERLVKNIREIANGTYLVRSETTLKTDSQTFSDALKSFDEHFSMVEHFLNQAMRELNKDSLKPEQILFDKLQPLDRRILPLAADMILAGVDPLAQTALAMFYHLSLHPAQQQRAHDEIHWASEIMKSNEVPGLPYVAACAREALRLHPATGGVVRRSREGLVVSGFEVPAGVDIVLAHGVTSKLEKQWGRAKAFIPERWCTEGWEPIKASKAHSLASMPFGESCPASDVVGKILETLTAKVLEKYRLEWHGPAPNMVTTGVNRIQRPYYFVLQNAA